jgi:hypothetical protein
MLAAMIAPTASAIEWPVLPKTCAANSVTIKRRRLRARSTDAGAVFIGG